MIYYIVLTCTTGIDNARCRRLINNGMDYHNSMGASAPILSNEMICSIVLTDVAAITKFKFNKDDDIRLCLEDGTSSYPHHNCLDMENMDKVTSLFKFFKDQALNVSRMVVYV